MYLLVQVRSCFQLAQVRLGMFSLPNKFQNSFCFQSFWDFVIGYRWLGLKIRANISCILTFCQPPLFYMFKIKPSIQLLVMEVMKQREIKFIETQSYTSK